jgi:beta-glucanase (GH16 family)
MEGFGHPRASAGVTVPTLEEYKTLEARVTALEHGNVPPPSGDEPDYTDLSKFTPTFVDTFDTGTSPDPKLWKFCFNDGLRQLSGNGEHQIYVDPYYHGDDAHPLSQPINPFKIADGVLSITADKTPAWALPSLWGVPYTSGMISTGATFFQQYGRFCARMKLPKGKGLWPAFWLLPRAWTWPPEWDPLEFFGAPNANGEGGVTKFHWGCIAVDNSKGAGMWIDTGVDLTAAPHTYSMEWTANRLDFFFDDRPVGGHDISGCPEFDQPAYMIVNCAVGGSWVGYPDDTTPLPARTEVAFVKAFQWK